MINVRACHVDILHDTYKYFSCVRKDDIFIRREYKLPRHSSWTCACKQTDLDKMVEKSVIKITKVERKISSTLVLLAMRDS
jgi:hypothetical protein